MKKLFILAALIITSTTVMADDTNWYIGGGIVESEGQFEASKQTDISTDSKLLELGYNGEIFGSNIYGGKFDNSREFINNNYAGAELDAGWKFHLGDSFTIKPYALVGAQISEDNDPTYKAGFGLMSTFKFLYLDIEVAEQNTADLADSSDTTDKFNETSTTATIGFTF